MRILCVTPRFGENILGGAESLVRGFAEHAVSLGIETHILTTCAVDPNSWSNVLPRGHAELNGVQVWRYPLEPVRSVRRQHHLQYQLMTHQWLDVEEQYEWLDIGPHSPTLYAHLQRFGMSYSAIVLLPYLFPLVQYAATIFPDRSVIWPCLHDEPFARMESTRLMLSQSRGVLYNSEPERFLAEKVIGVQQSNTVVAGVGVDDIPGNAQRFRQRYLIGEPFMLYAGRLEPTKNVHVLLDDFLAYKRKRSGGLKLVLMGSGTLEIPEHPDIVPVGFLNTQDKHDAYAAAAFLCNPSLLESFSIVLMEAWMAGTPVLVHMDCAVTSFYCRESNGGLAFSNQDEFIDCVDWFLSHPAASRKMALQGRAYVQTQFNWHAVTQRVLRSLDAWLK